MIQIFDLDRTLVRKNASFSFYFYLLRHRMVPLTTLARIIPICFIRFFARLSLKELHMLVFRAIMRGRPRQLFESAVPLFLDKFLTPFLNSAVLARFQAAKERGEHTFLLSSSPDFIVGIIAARLGFDSWKGTEYGVDKEGRLCEISLLIDGTAKLQLAKQFAQEKTIVYSDSEDDLPLLLWANSVVVVGPKRRLKLLAKLNKWEVL